MKTFDWDGKGMDCETCGWNTDSAYLEVSPDGTFDYSGRYGCYSGFRTGEGSRDYDGALNDINHILSFSRGEPIGELKRMKKELKKLKEKND